MVWRNGKARSQQHVWMRLVALGTILWIVSIGAAMAADLNHPPLFPNIKTFMIAYGRNYPADQLSFMNSHYDARIGDAGGNPALGALDAPGFSYTNYYCLYVGREEYLDAQAWAQSQGVDFEAFFLHYAEDTTCKFGSTIYTLPAGSRVPTYGWYDTRGDLTTTGARVVMNPGNPGYRAWKLDYLARQMAAAQSNGVFIDNTRFNGISALPTVSSGGKIQEYPDGVTSAYGDDLLLLFQAFTEHFGASAGQVPNMAGSDDPRVYPYVWGIFREFLIQPNGVPSLPMIDKNIVGSSAAGVRNLLGSSWTDTRWDMAALAFFYLVQDNSCYFFPYLNYVTPGWSGDPRLNQWYNAVTYDIGKPLGPRTILQYGIDPSAAGQDTFTATVEKKTTSLYRLTDATKTWTENQWKNQYLIFPSGFSMKVYQSGEDWIELYNPAEIPGDGTYRVATSVYTVYARDYEKAIVLWRPKNSATANIEEASAVTVTLPVTSDNTSGKYYLLTREGKIATDPLTSLSLRNTDGAVLIKDSGLVSRTIFSDIPMDFWAYDSIYAAVQAGIVTGYEDGTYRPALLITRDQMAVFISRALAGGDTNIPTPPAVATFSDVPTDFWAFLYIEHAVKQQVVEGYSDGTYRPFGKVNRAQMAVYIARMLCGGDAYVPTGPVTATFPDIALDHWAFRHIEYIAQPDRAIAEGFPDGTYRPAVLCRRDQMAAFIARAFALAW